jgi:glycosyltransferase involved in cell wall biosynthesis
MSLYNSAEYLREAIENILNQTFSDFEFIIIDDGSSDNSLEIAESHKDKRIVIVKNEKNIGLPASLNKGIRLARGEYIARMDPDDISLRTRFEKQVGFMTSRPDVSACGTWVKSFGQNRTSLTHKFFTNSEDIKASLLFNTSMAHPSVMLRHSVLDKNDLRYDVSHLCFEDYTLWVALSEFSNLANIPEVLLCYRMHPKSMSSKNAIAQKNGASGIRLLQLQKMGLEPTEEEMHIHNSLYPADGENIKIFLDKEEKWLQKILKTNKQKNIYNQKSLDKIIYTRFRLICAGNSKDGLDVWKKFVHSEIFVIGGKNKTIDNLKMSIKCFLKK